MNLSGERWGRTFLWGVKRIVRSPHGLGVGRHSVGKLKVHWNSGGSVRYPPGLLLDVEHCKVRDAFVSRATALVHFPPPRVVGHDCRGAETMAVTKAEATFCLFS